MKKASVILIPKSGTKTIFLGLLKNKKYGFIGGKLDKNESFIKAALRELEEESGIKTKRENLLYLGKSLDKDRFMTNGYLLLNPKIRKIPDYSSEEGKLVWVSSKILLSEKARFPKWNSFILQKLKDVY